MISPCPLPVPAGFSSRREIDQAGVDFSNAPPNDPVSAESVQLYRTFRMCCLSTTLGVVAAARMPARALVSVRLKRLDSILRKIKRDSFGAPLSQMYDVVGVRIVCESLQDVLALSGSIRSLPEFAKCNDYINAESPSGARYRAVHLIMRFKQPLTADKSISVRFEIQVRSFLQHQWAVWTESKGERAKAGRVEGDLDERQEIQSEHFRNVSERIAGWEGRNPGKVWQPLPPFSGGRDIAVAWGPPSGAPMCELFHDDVAAAVKHLNYLETVFPGQRGNALLLVGVTDQGNAEKILHLTHPLQTAGGADEPEIWLPPDA